MLSFLDANYFLRIFPLYVSLWYIFPTSAWFKGKRKSYWNSYEIKLLYTKSWDKASNATSSFKSAIAYDNNTCTQISKYDQWVGTNKLTIQFQGAGGFQQGLHYKSTLSEKKVTRENVSNCPQGSISDWSSITFSNALAMNRYDPIYIIIYTYHIHSSLTGHTEYILSLTWLTEYNISELAPFDPSFPLHCLKIHPHINFEKTSIREK